MQVMQETVLIPGLGRSPGGGNGNMLQYSCLENPVDRRTWGTTVCVVAKSQAWLRNWAEKQNKGSENSDWIQLNKSLSNFPEPKRLILETVNDISVSGFCYQLLPCCLAIPAFFVLPNPLSSQDIGIPCIMNLCLCWCSFSAVCDILPASVLSVWKNCCLSFKTYFICSLGYKCWWPLVLHPEREVERYQQWLSPLPLGGLMRSMGIFNHLVISNIDHTWYLIVSNWIVVFNWIELKWMKMKWNGLIMPCFHRAAGRIK